MFMQNIIKLSVVVRELSCTLFALSCNGKESEKSGPVTLTFDLWPWNSLGFEQLSRHMLLQNFIKLRAAVHELSCVQKKKRRKNTHSPSLPRGQ